MLPGPVFFHELRTVARRRRTYALRTVLGLFFLYLLVAPLCSWSWNENGEYSIAQLATLGSVIFGNIAWLQGLAIVLLTPAFVAGAITDGLTIANSGVHYLNSFPYLGTPHDGFDIH